LNTRCVFNDGPAAYRSAPDLMVYPQTTFPFEIFDLPFHATEATLPN
jgi:hypothetical protein